MPRKAIQRSAEEKYAIVMEGVKSGNIAETCHNHRIAATLVLPLERRSGEGSIGCAWGQERGSATRLGAGEVDQATGAGVGPVALAD